MKVCNFQDCFCDLNSACRLRIESENKTYARPRHFENFDTFYFKQRHVVDTNSLKFKVLKFATKNQNVIRNYLKLYLKLIFNLRKKNSNLNFPKLSFYMFGIHTSHNL